MPGKTCNSDYNGSVADLLKYQNFWMRIVCSNVAIDDDDNPASPKVSAILSLLISIACNSWRQQYTAVKSGNAPRDFCMVRIERLRSHHLDCSVQPLVACNDFHRLPWLIVVAIGKKNVKVLCEIGDLKI